VIGRARTFTRTALAAGILVDTNVLVYAHDRGEPEKQRIAVDALDALHTHGVGWLSTQCLGEFFWATTRGRSPRLGVAEAMSQVQRLAAAFAVLSVTPAVVSEALRGVREHLLPCWDAQLWATARLNHIPMILSEDFDSGAEIERVLMVDPFREGFRVETLLRGG